MQFWTAIWQSIILGTVQGLTEFLPVSSSGHLLLFHKLLGADFGGNVLFVDVMLHIGTLLAVFLVMRKQIAALFKKPFKALFMLVVATIPAALVGYLCGDFIDGIFNGERGLLYVSLCFAVTALMLSVCELVSKRRKKLSPLGWKNAIGMGVMQAVALFPGISRSGSTIAAGVVSGAERRQVADFSFLMSIPIILGSAILSSIDLIKEPSAVTGIGASGFIGLAFGMVFAAVAGYVAIRFMLRIIQKANYKWFSLYLGILCIVCLSLFCAGVV